MAVDESVVLTWHLEQETDSYCHFAAYSISDSDSQVQEAFTFVLRVATVPAMPSTTGLRERKRLRAMQHIQQTALDLYDAHGYDAVTVEQIASESQVSPSSVYRYFGTKEQILLWDDYDPQLMRLLASELAEHQPVDALRRAISTALTSVFGGAGQVGGDEQQVRRRLDYILTEPALRSASTEQMEGMSAWAGAVLAEQTGREPADLEVMVVAQALVWSLVAALRHWHATGYAAPLQREFDRAFAVLEQGLQLD